ncbi:SDR family oxidoreductase [Microbacterium murale]|uniref:NAD(P)-dependent dehydrogenase (Short-subunit alcohol dehydrogenase family) n=1 Tax=Microbacterium murale TaxID=1081040 RepID=A0ABU0PBP9_9MICO|nr:SDR family oxidoreductase [Microbacterium murale]MDQ0644382.1 NAD(P)-dependent dehydrogenase (short-subunit alcohol dehydrogenase family) [Microbacterium murale]
MARRNIDITISPLAGSRAVVTGGSDGIGLRIVTRLALAGAELVLPVRNTRKAEAAVTGILEKAPDAQITILPLDLSSLESVARFGEDMARDGRPVHLLINNAGVMTPPTRQTTRDGFELQFGTNHLGHFALASHLLPLLRAGRARVTSQISIAANQGAINWADVNWERSYDGMRAYSQSKIAFGLFGLELERRSQAHGWGITSNLSHPGIAPTSLLSARDEIGRTEDTLGVRVIRWASKRGIVAGTPETAALPALYASTSPDAVAGRLYGPRGIGHLGGGPAEQKLYSRLRSEQDAERMWQVSEKLTGVSFP